MSRTLQSDGAWRLRTVDQTLLPFEWRDIALTSAESCREAIVAMRVRGAPLIGAVGAYGLAFALRDDPSDAALAAAIATEPSNSRTVLRNASAIASPV